MVYLSHLGIFLLYNESYLTELNLRYAYLMITKKVADKYHFMKDR
jgi:hypothetical protein